MLVLIWAVNLMDSALTIIAAHSNIGGSIAKSPYGYLTLPWFGERELQLLNHSLTNYRWYVLVLAVSTMALAVMMPDMCMSVLFAEISQELDLSFVQIGTIWGIAPLGSVAFLFVGGVLCDRFGVKRTVSMACLLGGIVGAMRGLSNGFASLVAISFLLGLLISMVPIGLTKASYIWFPSRQLGLASGVLRTGSGIGSAISSMISATYLSPLLGGWRNVLFLYGAISVVLGIIWILTIKETQYARKTESETKVPVRQAISRVLHIRDVWLLGLTLFAYVGGMRAIAGYLPVYLRNRGWMAIHADGALTAFNLVGTAGAIPLALVSDRVGRRKAVLVPAASIAIVCAGLLPIVSNAFVWAVVIALGVFFSAYIAITITMCLETEGVGAAHSGMAVGLLYTLQRVGHFMAPPVGNSLASINLGMPFVFWASLFVFGLLILILVKETGWRVREDSKVTKVT